MDKVNALMDTIAWWKLVGLGIPIGVIATVAVIFLAARIASGRNYMPGPFTRVFTNGEGYRLMPPSDDRS